MIADTGGVLRAKAVPAERIEVFASSGMGASPSWAVFCVDNSIAMTDRLGVVGDLRLTADLACAVVLDGGFAWAPADVRTQDGQRSPLCWRDVARRQLDQVEARGLSVRMGFELELTLLDSTGRRLGEERGWPAYGLGPFSAIFEFMASVVERMAQAGIPVDQVHAEYGIGQVEMSLPPTDPVQAADAVLLARTVVGRTAREFEMSTSFSPMPFADGVGNGAHVHLSLARDGLSLFSGGTGPAELQPEAEHIIAGIVGGLPESMAVLAGSVVSGDRLIPDHWAGAFSCWGVENREAAVRLIAATHGNPYGANAEVKCVDAAANPYLTVGILLGLAMAGIDGQCRLPPPVDVNPAALSPEETAAADVRPLPTSLHDTLERFERSGRMRAILGDDLHSAVVAVRRHELDAYTGADRHALTRFAWSA